MLFLHGFLGSCHDFDEAIVFLSKNFYCLSVDLPGHGKTQVLGGKEYYTIPKIAEGLIDLLNELKIHQCLLVGYSMGGRIALYLTLHFSDRFCQVILESTSPGLKTEIERQERLKKDEQLAQELETINLDLFLEKWYDQPLFKSFNNHPNFQKVLAKRLNNNPLELAKSIRYCSLGLQASLWEKLKTNNIPVVLLVGELDQKFVAINQQMASLSPSITLEIIPNCGHNIHVENINKFVQIIGEWFIPNPV